MRVKLGGENLQCGDDRKAAILKVKIKSWQPLETCWIYLKMWSSFYFSNQEARMNASRQLSWMFSLISYVTARNKVLQIHFFFTRFLEMPPIHFSIQCIDISFFFKDGISILLYISNGNRDCQIAFNVNCHSAKCATLPTLSRRPLGRATCSSLSMNTKDLGSSSNVAVAWPLTPAGSQVRRLFFTPRAIKFCFGNTPGKD